MPLSLLAAALLLAPPSQRALDPDDLLIQVLDARSDAPIEGARVYRSYAPRALLRQYEPFSGNDRSIGRTDAHGVATLAREYPVTEDDSLLVRAGGYESCLQPLGPSATFARRGGVVCLEPLRALVGQVHDPEGAPKEGELEVVVTAWLANPNRAALVPVPVWDTLYRPTEFRESVRADGTFGPLLVPRAELMTLQVEHPRTWYRSAHIVLASSGPLPHVDVHLPELATVSVRAPVGGGEAAIEADYSGSYGAAVESRARGWHPIAVQRVGSEHFEVLARVRPGRVRVGLALDAHGAWFFRPLDPAPGAVVDLTLEPPAFRPTSGRVVDSEGLPVAEARVSWWSQSPRGRFQREPPAVRTAEDGRFRLEHVMADSLWGELRVQLGGNDPARAVTLYGASPGAVQTAVLPKRGTGTLTVHVEADGAESVWCHVVRRDGSASEPRSHSWHSRSGEQQAGKRWLLTRQVLAVGAYSVLGYDERGQCHAAEVSVVIEPGEETEVVLRLESPGTLELRPATGALDATPVTLRRGDARIVLFGQVPILPTSIALAPGPITVDWEWPFGVRHSRTVQISSGMVVTVALDEQ